MSKNARWVLYPVLAVGLAAIAFLALTRWIPEWVWHPLGACTGTYCKGYQLWSGIGSDLQEVAVPVTLVASLLVAIKFYKTHLTCHVTVCNRPALHHVVGTPYRTCAEHHPMVPSGEITAKHITQAYRNAGS